MSAKRGSPSADRNKVPIWDVLAGTVFEKLATERKLHIVEIAAGSGVHTHYFCSKIQTRDTIDAIWYPTDMDHTSLQSIQAYKNEDNLFIAEDPMKLTLDETGILEQDTKEGLPTTIDLMICINMIHISPWDATIGLMKLARDRLCHGGILYCYGPFKIGGTAVQSNLDFDQSLRGRNPEWGVRELEHVLDLAEYCDLKLRETVDMPANNLSLIFQKK